MEVRRGGSGSIGVEDDFAFGKLQGVVFGGEESGTEHRFEYYMTSERLVMGRSGPEAASPLDAVNEGVDLGVGDSSKLSRKHAEIAWNGEKKTFELKCMGRNGLTVTQNDTTSIMVPETAPQKLNTRALIQLGDCLLVFLLPKMQSTMRAPQDWIKADHKVMHSLILRFGYGRWDAIRANSGGRLDDKPDEELIYVARKLIAKCTIHAKAGIEKKTVREVLKEDLPDFLSPEEIAQQVERDLREAEVGTDTGEKRKYLRWARKLRLLRNLRDAANHSSLERLRSGNLTIHTPAPTPWWTAADDHSLLVGTYKHGYGSTDLIRADPELSFYGRVIQPAPSSSKLKKSGTGDTPAESEEDEDDDDDEEEEEKKKEHIVGKEENIKVKKNGRAYGDVKKEEAMVVDSGKGKEEEEEDEEEDDDDDEEEEGEGGTKGKGENRKSSNAMEVSAPLRVDDGADAATEGKYVFPNPDALMRRLKSVINACMREVERDLREESKVREHEAKIRQREEAKQDAAVAKQERDAARIRAREERRINRMQPFSKRDAAEFVRNLVDMGIAYKDGMQRDWEWFMNRVDGLKHKYPETLEDAYKSLVQECHRLLEMRDREVVSDDEEEGKKVLEQTIFVHNLERAEKVLERLEFFQYLRTVVLVYPTLGQTLRGVKRPKELPDWWRSVQDRALLNGVNKYGLNNWEAVERDPELGFEQAARNFAKKHDGQNIAERRMAFPKPGACQKRVKKIIDHFRTRASTANVADDVPLTESRALKNNLVYRTSKPAAEPSSTSKKRKAKKAPYTKPDLPFQVSDTLKIIDFGDVQPDRTGWDDNDHVFPLGFKSMRTINDKEFFFEIVDPGADSPPLFTVQEVSSEKSRTSADSANDAWTQISANAEIGDATKNGLEAMGLTDPKVREHILHLPGVDRCKLFDPKPTSTPAAENVEEMAIKTHGDEKPKDAEEPMKDIEEPLKDEEEPEKDDGGPEKDDGGPEKDDEGPRKDDGGPKKDDGGPKKNGQEPENINAEPKKNGEEPKNNNGEPELKSEEPKKDDEEPKKDDEKPKKDDEETERDKKGPKKDDEEPKKDTEEPKKDTEESKKDTEECIEVDKEARKVDENSEDEGTPEADVKPMEGVTIPAKESDVKPEVLEQVEETTTTTNGAQNEDQEDDSTSNKRRRFADPSDD